MVTFFKRVAAFLAALITLLSRFAGTDIKLPGPADSFRVTSYVIASTVTDKARLCSEDFDIITDVIIFGSTDFDRQGNIIVDKPVFETALANLREVIGERDISISVNLLGPGYVGTSDKWEDWMDGQTEAHNAAFESGVFEENIVALLDEYDLDGVHFDYEYPISVNAWYHFNKFLVRLDKYLGDKTLGVATNEWNLKFNNAAVEAVDTFELMMYDIYNEEDGRHSTYEDITYLVQKGALRGIPLEKVNMGLPFYARPTDHDTYWYDYCSFYDKLDEDGWYHDETLGKDFWFNTPDVIEAKTRFARESGYGGVMIWHYSCDIPSTQEKSLLAAVGRGTQS